MVSPTAEHESRRVVLATLADLSGYTAELKLQGLLPDVSRANGRGDVFLADAKATETPGCSSTRFRLNRYARWLGQTTETPWCRTATLALAVGDRAEGWMRLLDRVLETERLFGWAQHTIRVDSTCIVLSARSVPSRCRCSTSAGRASTLRTCVRSAGPP